MRDMVELTSDSRECRRVGAEISVVINTLNSEVWLDYALRSVEPWADEIVVVDMHSDDRTREIAAARGARVLLHERVGYVEPARAFAVAQATHEWILILDSDEMVPEPLSRRLREIAATDEADAVSIPRMNYLFGAPVLHSGWGADQDRAWRFSKRGRLTFPDRIHGALAPSGDARGLRLAAGVGLDLVHFNYIDVSDFVERLNRYTSVEVRGTAERKGTARGVAFSVPKELVLRWFRFAAWRDGWRGRYLTLMMMCYRVVAAAKAHEAREVGDRAEAEGRYRDAAERLTRGYATQPAATPPEMPRP
jgi:glycosyltransferase involved in cell wall biosynthesis